MNVSDLVRLSALLRRLAGPPAPAADEDRHVSVRRGERGPGTTVYDRYAPRGGRRATVIAVHGVLLPGREDARLVHFGRSLARSGVACLVPTLEGLAEARWDPRDVDALEGLVGLEASASGAPVGIVSFCVGGGYSLLAASRSSIAEQVRFVLCFGAYHDLGQVLDGYATRADVEPVTEADWDDWIYLHLVTAYRHMDDLELAPALRARVATTLRDYCGAVSAKDKRDLYQRELVPRDLMRFVQTRRDASLLETLSPSGKLAGLRAIVSLIHDPRDVIVPVDQAARIMAELQALPGGARHRLAVTSLIAHTDLGTLLRPVEVVRFLSALQPIVSATP